MSIFKLVGLAYGIFLFVGAFLGFKAGSKISLVAGLVSGALALMSAFLATSNFVLASRLLTFVSGFLSVTFLIRFLKTQRFMPSGMLLFVSLVVLIFSVSQILKK